MPRPPLRFVAPALVVVALVVAAIIVVPRLGGGDEVRLDGQDVTGLDADALRALVDQIAPQVLTIAVTMPGSGGDVTAPAGDLGVAVDTDATVQAVLDTTNGDVPFHVRVDPAVATPALARLDTAATAVREPTLDVQGGQVVAVPGATGVGLPSDAVVAALENATWSPPTPVHLDVAPRTLEPRYSLDDATALAGSANDATAAGLMLQAGDNTVTADAAEVRSWVTSSPGPTQLDLALKPDVVNAALTRLFGSTATAPTDARFDVVEGKPVLVSGQPGRACCSPDAPGVLIGALTNPVPGPVVLPLAETAPAETDAELSGMGIVEEVATFTTSHRAGEPRVRNIHRVADIMKGYVLAPGAMLSMNGILGQRTVENGYVSAPAIVNGQLNPEVGGGISQFMTTLFNAAFFAGLDYGEYQSHTIYISRYPYGREATINWQHPDLQVRNTTSYGVLIWPTYTDTTITVTLYSTKVFSNVEQTGQTKVKSGVACDAVTTERTRTYLDGHQVVDTVKALYRPENTLCNGNPADGSAPSTTTTSTTAPAATTVAPTTTAPAATTVPPTVPTTPAPTPEPTTAAPPDPATTVPPA